MKTVPLLFALLLAEIGFFMALSSDGVPSAAYLQSYFLDLVVQAAPTLLVAYGMTLILMTGGIDLSVASIIALISCVMSCFEPGPSFWWKALPAGLAMGLSAGALNGLLVARLDVPPIIATLGTMIFFRGLCYMVMGDLERSPFLDVRGYDFFGHAGGAVALVLVVFVAGGTWFTNSIWRRHLLMIGGNRVAAHYAAIPVGRRLVETYMLMGLLAFLAALAFTGRNGSVSASSLTGMELHVIVAVVLGGTKVQGGSGTLIGTVFGVLFVAVLDEGLRGAATWGTRNLPFRISHLEYVLLGLLLVTGVALGDKLRKRGAS